MNKRKNELKNVLMHPLMFQMTHYIETPDSQD